MQEILTALEQRHDLPDEALCALLETDAMDGALFQGGRTASAGNDTARRYLSGD